jgi:hypothetical protein
MSLAQVYNGIGLMYILTMIEQVRTIHNERDRRSGYRAFVRTVHK